VVDGFAELSVALTGLRSAGGLSDRGRCPRVVSIAPTALEGSHPIGKTIKDQGSRFKDQGSRIKDSGSMFQDFYRSVGDALSLAEGSVLFVATGIPTNGKAPEAMP